MNVRGTIYHNPQFKFCDGTVGNKLLVLLNTPTGEEDYLFVKTTSRQKGRTKKPGCGTYYAQGEYFIPQGTDCFPEDTWVLLYDLYPIPPNDIDEEDDWHVLEGGTLSIETIKQIIDCLFEHHSEDIPEMYEAWLRPPMENNLLKLAEKFNCQN
jgi:hypothetical protein